MFEDNNSSNGQFLTFVLNNEIFALDIKRVREVLEVTNVTSIPRTPDYMKGVINLRGHAVPVVDMRLKLGMSETDRTVDTCIVILELALGDDNIEMGALVDSVREVFEITENEIEPAPKMGSSVRADYIQGMARQGDDFVIIIDVNSVFSEEELELATNIVDE